ncbi:sigma-70 family RNA polymerase sigma factor [Amycolatopsis sp. FDAARGOS 1241]|uniref:sigma-70 family RNA polymerase sigma factor n=1 Tax=Amycolatopsis sp. FDAARGOS 1241 TaxID=2778070 RepID=UPI00195003D8|nr:sigma-70 family RNA polymerase sigma factor [Amycolatopsis sp. FDAARGOS 1241]QRP46743.1 sigma-70 family RNA polymerase sigma factor [Amycolatopsis sp. FDAARGOS 1241]
MTTDDRAPAPRPERRVVEAAVDGDRAAVAELLEFLRPLVLRYCRGRLGTHGSGSVAEDCAQDVLLAVLVELPRYRYEPESFLPFVFGIASHKVIDEFRRRARNRADPHADPADENKPGPDEYARTDARLQIEQLLDHLPPAQRELLTLRVLLGYTAEETATALGLPSAAAVRVSQHRALAKLRRLLQGGPLPKQDD